MAQRQIGRRYLKGLTSPKVSHFPLLNSKDGDGGRRRSNKSRENVINDWPWLSIISFFLPFFPSFVYSRLILNSKSPPPPPPPSTLCERIIPSLPSRKAIRQELWKESASRSPLGFKKLSRASLSHSNPIQSTPRATRVLLSFPFLSSSLNNSSSSNPHAVVSSGSPSFFFSILIIKSLFVLSFVHSPALSRPTNNINNNNKIHINVPYPTVALCQQKHHHKNTEQNQYGLPRSG